MPTNPVGPLTDEILAALGPFLAHQRHKWAAQCQAFGLSMAHFQVLAILDGEGPTPMSRLADQLGLSFSNVTGIVGRMEERGVVERVHDATDRRVVLARLTPGGLDMVRRVEDVRLQHMRQLVSTLTAEQQATVLGALVILSDAHTRLHAEEHDDRERPQHPHSESRRPEPSAQSHLSDRELLTS